MNSSVQFHKFVQEKFVDGKEAWSEEEYVRLWSPFRVKQYHTQHVSASDLVRPDKKLAGVTGTASMYQFAGNSNPGVETTADTVEAKAKGFDHTLKYKLTTRRLCCMCAKCHSGKAEECLLAASASGLFGVEREDCVLESVVGTSEAPLTREVVSRMKVVDLHCSLSRRQISPPKGALKQVLVALLLKSVDEEDAERARLAEGGGGSGGGGGGGGGGGVNGVNGGGGDGGGCSSDTYCNNSGGSGVSGGGAAQLPPVDLPARDIRCV
jgi:hypothetical protein